MAPPASSTARVDLGSPGDTLYLVMFLPVLTGSRIVLFLGPRDTVLSYTHTHTLSLSQTTRLQSLEGLSAWVLLEPEPSFPMSLENRYTYSGAFQELAGHLNERSKARNYSRRYT